MMIIIGIIHIPNPIPQLLSCIILVCYYFNSSILQNAQSASIKSLATFNNTYFKMFNSNLNSDGVLHRKDFF
jgi:hypothetical protein